MQQVKDNPGLKNWISELMSSNVEEGKSWSIKSKIAELGEELFKENYMLFDKHILDKFSDKEFLKNYRSFLTATVQAYESRQAAIGQEAIGLIRSEGLEQTDFKGGKAGCVSYFYKLVAGNFDEPTATVRKGAQDSAARGRSKGAILWPDPKNITERVQIGGTDQICTPLFCMKKGLRFSS